MATGEVVRWSEVGNKGNYNNRRPTDRRSIGEKILAGRIKGRTMRELAAEQGIGEATAYRYMHLALDSRLVPTVDEFRKRENERLDRTQRMIEENIDAANLMVSSAIEANDMRLFQAALDQRSKALALQLTLDARRARLNGLDAPIRVDAKVEHTDSRDAELDEMIREAKARLAAEEARTDG